jgi:hypothetical protein
MSESSLDGAEIFFGQATPAEARLYVRVTMPETPGDVTLSGNLSGPFCRYAQTLPLTVPLHAKSRPRAASRHPDEGERPQALSEVVIPDPCFWTPELPFHYRVQLELRRETEIIDTAQRVIGVRRLGVRGRHLFFEGKRWVLRGIRVESTDWRDLTAWRNASAAMMVPSPSDQLCEELSETGILVVAELQGTAADIATELARLSRWPAVGLAILRSTETFGIEIRRRAPNILLGQRTKPGAAVEAEWAHVALCEASDLARFSGCAQETRLPVIAERCTTQRLPPNAARAECDRLQSDLADVGDFAGYVV